MAVYHDRACRCRYFPAISATSGQHLWTSIRADGLTVIAGPLYLRGSIKFACKDVEPIPYWNVCYYPTRLFGPTSTVHFLLGLSVNCPLSELRSVIPQRVEITRFPMMYLRAALPHRKKVRVQRCLGHGKAGHLAPLNHPTTRSRVYRLSQRAHHSSPTGTRVAMGPFDSRDTSNPWFF